MCRNWVGSLVLLMLFSMAGTSQANQSQAIQACQEKIRNVYDVRKFRNVFAEKTGHHKYRVYGKVKARGDRYPFNCRIKRGSVRSYSYNGPHGDRHKDSNKNLAIGVGLAALAAAVIASSNADSDNITNIDKENWEDDCHDELARRIRHEHDEVTRVRLDNSQLRHQGRKLTGTGHIRWDYGQPSAFEFMCKFDHNGRIIDSSYSYY